MTAEKRGPKKECTSTAFSALRVSLKHLCRKQDNDEY